jgi:glutamyl-tRNA synthetase
MKSGIRTRFAPSPTGHLHIGGARTALFAWLYARHTGGKFILRIEDTDAERSTDEYTKAILNAMEWLELEWDEGPFFQSQRLDVYRGYVEKLIENGRAYWCECTPDELEKKREEALKTGGKPKYDGTCRSKNLGPGPGRVVRFSSPAGGTTSFEDLIKGVIAVDNSELDDLIILRSDNMPTYNFTVVIDDATMNITHVIRGDDHVNNTPRQIAMYEALGFPLPVFAHVPMILGSDKTRLSKRHGATSVMAYREMGYLPEALVNYLVRLSWAHGDQEIFTRQELIDLFDLKNVGRSAAVFNPEKLLWLNHHYIKTGDIPRLAKLLIPFVEEAGLVPGNDSYIQRVVEDVRERTHTLKDMPVFGDFYFKDTVENPELAQKFLTADMIPVFRELATGLEVADLSDKKCVEDVFVKVLEKCGIKFKQLAQPVRVALTGKTNSPGIFEIIMTLGDKVLPRLRKALEYMESVSVR